MNNSIQATRMSRYAPATALVTTFFVNLTAGHAQPSNDPSAGILATCRELNRARIQFAGSNNSEVKSHVREVRNACSTIRNALSDQNQMSSLRQKTSNSDVRADGSYGPFSANVSVNISRTDLSSDSAFASKLQNFYTNNCSDSDIEQDYESRLAGQSVTYFDNTPMVQSCIGVLRAAPVLVSVVYSALDATLQIVARQGATNPTITLSYNRTEITCVDNAGVDMFGSAYCPSGSKPMESASAWTQPKAGGCRIRIGSDGQTVSCRLRDSKLRERAVIVSFGEHQQRVPIPTEPIPPPPPTNPDIVELKDRVGKLEQRIKRQSMRWELASYFSGTNGNPNGEWTYGWARTDYSNFTPSVAQPTASMWRWSAGIGNDQTPSVWQNITSMPLYGVAPGQVALHPGPNQEPSIVRWSNPSKGIAGRLRIYGSFFPGDGGVVRVLVRINDKTEWAVSNSGSFNLVRDANTVNTVDFAVDSGYTSGSTPLVATIERIE